MAITPALYNLGTTFQRLYLCFHGWPTQWNGCIYEIPIATMKTKMASLKPKVVLSLATVYIPLGEPILTARIMFSRVADTMGYRPRSTI